MRAYTPNIQAKRDKRTEDIARVAAQLFQEKGYDGVSLLDIAGKMKLGRTTLYEYFRSKHEVLAFHLVREMRIYHRRVTHIFEDAKSFRDTVEEFLDIQLAYGAIHAGFGHLLRALERDASHLAKRTKAQIVELHGEVYDLMTNAIQAAIVRGEIRNVHAGLLMQLLVHATSLPIRGTGGTDRPAQAILDVFWRGIGKRRMRGRATRWGGLPKT